MYCSNMPPCIQLNIFLCDNFDVMKESSTIGCGQYADSFPVHVHVIMTVRFMNIYRLLLPIVDISFELNIK